jgi:hypothetical protein
MESCIHSCCDFASFHWMGLLQPKTLCRSCLAARVRIAHRNPSGIPHILPMLQCLRFPNLWTTVMKKVRGLDWRDNRSLLILPIFARFLLIFCSSDWFWFWFRLFQIGLQCWVSFLKLVSLKNHKSTEIFSWTQNNTREDDCQNKLYRDTVFDREQLVDKVRSIEESSLESCRSASMVEKKVKKKKDKGTK